MYTVYKHTAPGGKVYIGITGIKPALRWRDGNGYKGNAHFTNAIKLYGWDNIQHEIIAEGLTKAQAAALEIELIAKHDSTNPAKGYNMSTGGESGAAGTTRSAEHRKKIAESNHSREISDASKEKNRLAHLGKKATPAAREKMRATRTGRTYTAEHRLNISNALKGEKHPQHGKKQSPETLEKKRAAAKNKRAVICLETGAAYSSAHEAGKAAGVHYTRVLAACRGKQKTAGGYHWKYI